MVVHIVADRFLIGHPHFHPRVMEDAGRVSHDFGIFFIGATVVEEVELDHLHALQLQIQERPRDPTSICTEHGNIPKKCSNARHLRIGVARRPIISPIDPRAWPLTDRSPPRWRAASSVTFPRKRSPRVAAMSGSTTAQPRTVNRREVRRSEAGSVCISCTTSNSWMTCRCSSYALNEKFSIPLLNRASCL